MRARLSLGGNDHGKQTSTAGLITVFLMNISAAGLMKLPLAVNAAKRIAVSRQNAIHLSAEVNEKAGSKVIRPFYY